MANVKTKIETGINIVPSTPSLTEEGDIAYDGTNHKLVVRDNSSTGNVVEEAKAATLTNKTLDDTTTIIADTSSPTKRIKFDAAGTAGTTTTILSSQTTDKTITLPDATDTLATLTNVTDHINDTVGAHAGTAISNTPSGNLGATDVQGALNELQSDIDTRALDSALTTHAGLTGTSAHGATTTATASHIVARDANGDIAANKLVLASGASGGIDVASAGDMLIGASIGANKLKLGASSSTIEIQGSLDVKGTVTAIESTTTTIVDPLITLNKSGGAASGSGVGIEVEENSSIAGYIKTSADRNAWELKAPNTAGIASLTPGASNDAVVLAAATQSLTNKSIGDSITFAEIATPSNPAANKHKFYTKSDGFFYTLNAAGNEVRVGAGSNGSAFTNFATNGNFELASTTGWTASAGTFVVTNTASNLYAGNWSGSWTPASAADTLINTAVVITSGGGPSGNGAVTLMYKTTSALHKLQVLDNTTVIAELLLPATTTYLPATLNFTFPTSSSGLNFRILAGDTNSIFLDEAFIGDARAINLSSLNLLSDWTSYTPTLGAGFGAATNVSFRWRRIGGNLEVEGTFTTGTVAASLATISLPAGLTLGTMPVVNASNAAGPAVGTFGHAAALSSGYLVTATGTSTSLVYVADYFGHSGGTQLLPLNGNSVFNSSTLTSVRFSVPILGWTSSLAVTPDLAGGSWTGYHSNDCSWTRSNAAYGDPTADATCTFTERKNINFGTVSSALSGSDKLPGIVFTPKAINKTYQITAIFKAVGQTASQNYNWQLTDGSVVIGETGYETSTSDNGYVTQFSISGTYVSTSTSATTIKLQSKGSSGNNTILAPSNNGSAIEWTIIDISQTLPTPIILAPAHSSVLLDTPNGHGSSSTAVRLYTVITTEGTALTATNSATLGSYVTANSPGIYSATVCDRYSSGVADVGIALNSGASGTTAYMSLTKAQRKYHMYGSPNSNNNNCGTVSLFMNTGDTLRVHENGTAMNGTVDTEYFSVVKVGEYS